ncbi:dTMP kinase, partial [Cribrihabitans sp. XS_ASV171]
DRWSAETEILLFTAARRDHLERTIGPSLAKGKVVICDRFADSTRMYQGLSRGDLRRLVDQLHELMIGREPDLTLLIDMDPETGLSRAKGRQGTEERFEDFGPELQRRMRAGFLALAEEFSARFRVVDGNRDIAAVAADVADIARQALRHTPS